MASENDHAKVVQILIENGADVNAMCKRRREEVLDVGMAYLGKAAATRQPRRRPHDKEAWVTLAVDMSHTRLCQGRPCTLVGRVALAFSLSSARHVASHGCVLPSDVW